uniref:Uncharacterized protein n=1 Tax=Oryza brachyantha TaxID=4533 RepID=J3L3T6_ORYBR
MNTLFIFCSAYCGQHSIGTPAVMPSSAEFHPQCVTNAPVAGWWSTSTCGAHDVTMKPLSLVRSMNPSGKSALRSGSGRCSKYFLRPSVVDGGARTTHMNRCPEFSKPTAISFSCSAENVPLLPKQRNTTLCSG